MVTIHQIVLLLALVAGNVAHIVIVCSSTSPSLPGAFTLWLGTYHETPNDNTVINGTGFIKAPSGKQLAENFTDYCPVADARPIIYGESATVNDYVGSIKNNCGSIKDHAGQRAIFPDSEIVCYDANPDHFNTTPGIAIARSGDVFPHGCNEIATQFGGGDFSFKTWYVMIMTDVEPGSFEMWTRDTDVNLKAGVKDDVNYPCSMSETKSWIVDISVAMGTTVCKDKPPTFANVLPGSMDACDGSTRTIPEGTVCPAVCLTGYTRVGDIVCEGSSAFHANWSSTGFQCAKDTCSIPYHRSSTDTNIAPRLSPSIIGVAPPCARETQLNGKCYYTCSGITGVSLDSIQCTDGGIWDVDPLFTSSGGCARFPTAVPTTEAPPVVFGCLPPNGPGVGGLDKRIDDVEDNCKPFAPYGQDCSFSCKGLNGWAAGTIRCTQAHGFIQGSGYAGCVLPTPAPPTAAPTAHPTVHPTFAPTAQPTPQPPVITPKPPVVTPQPPVITPQPPVVTPQPPVITPKPPVATPQPPVITPQPPVVTPQPPVITPKPPVVTPQPPVITPKPPVVTPQPPVITPQPPVITPKPPVVTPQPPVITPKPNAVTDTPLVITPTSKPTATTPQPVGTNTPGVSPILTLPPGGTVVPATPLPPGATYQPAVTSVPGTVGATDVPATPLPAGATYQPAVTSVPGTVGSTDVPATSLPAGATYQPVTVLATNSPKLPVTPLPFDPASGRSTPIPTTPIPEEKSGSILWIIPVIIVVLLLCGLGIYFFMKHTRKTKRSTKGKVIRNFEVAGDELMDIAMDEPFEYDYEKIEEGPETVQKSSDIINTSLTPSVAAVASAAAVKEPETESPKTATPEQTEAEKAEEKEQKKQRRENRKKKRAKKAAKTEEEIQPLEVPEEDEAAD